MAAIQLKAGELLPLHLNLGSGATGKFVRAVLKNESGTVLGASPATLTDVGDGLYVNNAIPKDANAFVIADYEIFEDSGFTTRSFDVTGDQDAADIFQLVDSSGNLSRNDSFTARFKGESNLRGVIKESRLKTKFAADTVTSKITADKLKAGFDSNNLVGKINC